jgi:hypothetical protein
VLSAGQPSAAVELLYTFAGPNICISGNREYS